jgi:hypothetical protein
MTTTTWQDDCDAGVDARVFVAGPQPVRASMAI